MELNKIYNENCLDTMKRMPDNFIDSIVTDPPYGISFMNKHWDYEIPSVQIWTEALRVLKPGGHILCACGTRTQHRMTVNIEDAGFEIRDVVAWIYGSGFPKSLNVGIAVNKLETEEWLKISNGIDNIEIISIFDEWKRNLDNVSFVGEQFQKSQIEIGMNMGRSGFVQNSVPQIINQEKLNVSAIIAGFCANLILWYF